MSDADPLGLGIDRTWGPPHARELLDACDWDLEEARQRVAGAHLAAHRNVERTAGLRRHQGMDRGQVARETRLEHDLVCRGDPPPTGADRGRLTGPHSEVVMRASASGSRRSTPGACSGRLTAATSPSSGARSGRPARANRTRRPTPARRWPADGRDGRPAAGREAVADARPVSRPTSTPAAT